MSLSVYGEYKESGSDWLGQIPGHWGARPLKFLGKAIIGLTYSPDDLAEPDEGVAVLRSTNVQNGMIDLKSVVFVNQTIPDQLMLRSNDVLICSRNGSRELIGKNALVSEQQDGMSFGAFMTVFRSPFNPFLFFVFNSQIFKAQSGLFMTSTVNQLTTGTLNSFVVPVPPEDEQNAIARFLNHETAKIDALIREQERLIALLQEKRQAVISHAVTKGLDPDVPMKDSGVEWLGEVPAHWVVTPLKRCSKLNPSKSGYLGSKSIDCTFLPMEKLKTDTIRRDEIRKISEVYDGYTYFEDGDVLFAKVTPCFENRNTALACYLMNGIGFGSSEIFVLRPETGIVGRFLFYRLLEDVLVNYWSSEMTGAGGLKRVPSSVVENFAIALPDRAEQEHICAYLDTAVKKFEELMAEAESAVALLKERRSALISAAVTGKIDVRNWQPPVDESAFDEEVRQAGMEVTA